MENYWYFILGLGTSITVFLVYLLLRRYDIINPLPFLPATETLKGITSKKIESNSIKIKNIGHVNQNLRHMELDYNSGIIDEKQLNVRQLKLKGIIEQSNDGELKNNENKVKAIRTLNRQRKRHGWKALDTNIKKEN